MWQASRHVPAHFMKTCRLGMTSNNLLQCGANSTPLKWHVQHLSRKKKESIQDDSQPTSNDSSFNLERTGEKSSKQSIIDALTRQTTNKDSSINLEELYRDLQSLQSTKNNSERTGEKSERTGEKSERTGEKSPRQSILDALTRSANRGSGYYELDEKINVTRSTASQRNTPHKEAQRDGIQYDKDSAQSRSRPDDSRPMNSKDTSTNLERQRVSNSSTLMSSPNHPITDIIEKMGADNKRCLEEKAEEQARLATVYFKKVQDRDKKEVKSMWQETAQSVMNKEMSNEDWMEFPEKLKDVKEARNIRSWPTVLMQVFYRRHRAEYYRNLSAGSNLKDESSYSLVYTVQSLEQFSRSHASGHPNAMTKIALANYMGILAHGGDPQHYSKIYELHDEINSLTPILDLTLAELVVIALSHTPRWRDCLAITASTAELYPDMHFGTYYGYAIAGALKHGDVNAACELITQHQAEHGLLAGGDGQRCMWALHSHRHLWPTFLAHFNRAKNVPNIDLAAAILNWFNTDPDTVWTGQLTAVDKNGRCQHCRQYLESQQVLPEADYATLLQAVYQDGLVRSDIYISSNPQETQKFEKFMAHCKPYSVVVDGLNMLALRNFQGSQGKYAKKNYDKLPMLVDYLTNEMGQNVLVFGRSFLRKQTWFKELKSKAQCYLVDNSSEDDPFMMIAALLGGPGTFLITRDWLRDHKARMQTYEVKRLYELWQCTHVLEPLYVNYDNSGYEEKIKARFRWPDKHRTSIQQTGRGWHIPHDVEVKERAQFRSPNCWICLQPEQPSTETSTQKDEQSLDNEHMDFIHRLTTPQDVTMSKDDTEDCTSTESHKKQSGTTSSSSDDDECSSIPKF